ncbi:universal stress protein [Tessaracoccus sp.]
MMEQSENQNTGGQQPKNPLIVVGVDGSDDGLRAVRFGANTALQFGGELMLVHAVDDAMLAGAWGVVYDPEVLQNAGVTANAQARGLALELGLPEDRIRTEVVLGSPGGVLGRLSEVADLIVLGRRSVSGLERMFVGSTSVSVVSNSSCPVLVISAAAHPIDVGGKKLIGVGMNTSPGSHTTLEVAFRQARRFHSSLEIVHALQPPIGLFAKRLTPDDLAEQLRYVRGGIDALATSIAERYPEVAYEVIVVADSPINELVGRSATYDALVLGISNAGFGLGGLVRGLMAHAECPLLITH